MDMGSIPSLERVEFFPGELLTADDLTTVDGNNQALRWLHNSTLHPWGICYGLDVKGARGATSVTVSPGYATDIQGREVILAAPYTLPIPAVPGASDGSALTYYLVANYVTDADETADEQREATACSPGGAVRLSNDPAIRWKTSAQLNNGIDVILGTVSIKNCALNANVSTAGRRDATAPPRFTIFGGLISVASLKLTAWKLGATNAGFTAPVDTSKAGFQSTPVYITQVAGSRTLPSSQGIVIDFVSISNQSPTGFTLQIAIPPVSATVNPAAITDPVKGVATIKQLGWNLSWVGLEA